MFFGTERRLVCVCALASPPTTDPRHPHARTRALIARCACKKRTRRPAKEDPAEFLFLSLYGLETVVYEAPPLPALSSVPVSQKFSTETHPAMPRASTTVSSPVLSEWSFSESDAVEEDKRELSARLRLMESRPSVPCLTWADKGLPSLRIEGCTLMSRRDRDDGRLAEGDAVFALEKLAHRVTLLQN